MTFLWKLCEHVSRAAVWLGALMLIVAALIVSAEVILRKGFASVAFTGSDELAAHLFAVGTSLSLAYVLVTKGHVRIDALYGLLGPRTRALLDILALLVLAIFVAALTERAYDVTMTSITEGIRSNTPLRVPLGIPQAGWLAGIVLFLVVLIIAILRSLLALLTGDLATVHATAGAATQNEEIESELKSLGITSPGSGDSERLGAAGDRASSSSGSKGA